MRTVFADPFWGRMLFAVIFGFCIYFFFDIVLYLTKRDFKNLELQAVHFTRNDQGDESDEVKFRTVDHMKLRPALDNLFLYGVVLWSALRAKKNKRVLDFGKKGKAILLPIRRAHVSGMRSAYYKSVAGMSSAKLSYWMFMVYDVSEDRTHYVLRCILVRTRDINRFKHYLAKPPNNERNFELVKEIREAFLTKSASHIYVQITAA
ncbi:MAG: hypothetical protein ACYCZ0_02070 [Minisyncoccota bacterium]